MRTLYGFLFCMWALIIAGGGIAVNVLGPLSISGYGDWDPILSSVIKGIVAIILVIVWVIVLLKVKQWIFHRTVG